MKVLIVEDDSVAYYTASLILSENEIEDIQHAEGYDEAKSMLGSNDYNLVLLDVHLGDGKGTDLIQFIPLYTKVIFTTSDPKYAVKAFEINAVDYIIKPISLERFNIALEKLDERKRNEGDLITIKADLNYYKIPVSNIIFIETSGGYLTLHTKADTYTFYGNIQDFHNKLASRDFMQCHRSYVVNMSYIASFKDSTLFMEDDHEVPVSRKHRKAIIDFFKN